MPEINQYLDLFDLAEIRNLCVEKGELRSYSKGDLFLSEEEVPDEFGFIASGYFKYVVKASNGMEKVVAFSLADDYVGHINSALLGIPGGLSIVAGCSVMAYVIPMDEFVSFVGGKGLRFCMGIQGSLFHTIYSRYLDMYRLSPRERYLKILHEYPDLLQRVPLCDIASYIGVTPIHLSRIRRNLHLR